MPDVCSSAKPVVSLRNLGLSYSQGKGVREVVHGVSLDVLPGEVLGLVGESGCGKSTIAKCMAGFLKPSSGDFVVCEGAAGPARGPHKVQMVFQDPSSSFDPRRTLGQSVTEGLRNAGTPKGEALARAGELFERCGLARELLDRYPHQVSGGQCQRAAIARALANNPSIMLCDEATSALDSTTTAQILDLLRRINRELNVTLVIITHSLSVARNICDRVAMIDGGRIVEMGDTEQLFANPQSDILKTLIADAAIENHRHHDDATETTATEKEQQA